MIHVLMPRLSLLATLGMLGASVLKDQVCLIARRSCIVPSFPTIYTVLSLLLGMIDYLLLLPAKLGLVCFAACRVPALHEQNDSGDHRRASQVCTV